LKSISKKNMAWLTLTGGFVIFGLKLAAYFLSGSVALLSDALESIVNLLASGLMIYAVYLSEEPADRTHNYGHQKVENISSLIEGILILVAAVMIAEKAVGRLIRPEQLSNINAALMISLAATSLNGLLSWLLLRTARKFGSLALEGDSKHLLSDVLSSVAVAAGLAVAKLTGWYFLDSALALAVSGLLIKMALELMKKSSTGLMDQSCPEEEARIIEVLNRHDQLFVDFHDIKTRRSGNRVFAEFHLSVKGDKTVEEAHNLTDHLEQELNQELPEVSLAIHVEPPRHQNQ
jgi:cation diffusion facilitator family transporter